MTIVLKNNTKAPKRMLVYNLAKPTVKVSNVVTVESRDGERRQKQTTKLVPDSIRIPCGGKSEELSEDVLQAPEIARAIERREVIVQQGTAPPVAAPEPSAPAAKVRSRRRDA